MATGLSWSPAHRSFPSDWREGWLGGRNYQAWLLSTSAGVTFRPDPELMTRYLRTLLFRKYALAGAIGGLAFVWGMTVYGYRMVKADACFRAAVAGRTETSDDDLMHAIRNVELLISHEAGATTLAALAGSPVEAPGSWANLLA